MKHYHHFRDFLLIFIVSGLLLCITVSCSKPTDQTKTLFEEMDSQSTGIAFKNMLTFSNDFNVYTYRNFYNGGGVALGDINNDGLIDVYLTANMLPNKLYLNKGNFQFEDITQKAGVGGTKAWSTGVSMADVNGDGYLDIYVCNSGDIKGDNKQNELFINNGNQTFVDRAEEYGVADKGYTTHAAFFDYDKDGDLDLYILNNSYQAIGSFNLRKNERPKRDVLGGDKLMRNDLGHFTDVSEAAGIYGSIIGFGLGVTIGDVDRDGWPDIYVSNDFFERDYLYINNKDGTFKERLTEQLKSISGASMGADMADIDNDNYPDIFVTEMLPQENARIKTVSTFENWDKYQYNLQNGYYHQFTRNMLQHNNGDGSFSEIGRLSGVEATDWSWGALLFDMDNDGLKDVFISNGIYLDLTNQDYLQYVSGEEVVQSIVSGKSVNYKKLIELIPSNPVPNYAFQNQGNLKFKNKASEWGLGKPSFSNGAAYGDLDNDGDMDLIVNNVNSEVSTFRNRSNELLPDHHYLKFNLKGIGENTFAFGTKIIITDKGKTFYLEQMPIRGFESSMDPRPNVGLGKIDSVDQIEIIWPDGKRNILKNIPTNQTLSFDQKNDVMIDSLNDKPKENTLKVSSLVEQANVPTIDFIHQENEFVDFDQDQLIFHMLSAEGPRISTGDINGDHLEDFYIGGSKGFSGALFVQSSNGKFKRTNEKVFESDKASEDEGSIFFDADGDHDMDLYVCSGGYEFSPNAIELSDRLYLNDGKGNLIKSPQILPAADFESTSTVKAADYDGDGDQDLFVGVRILPYLYGVSVNGYILNNNGSGVFSNVTPEKAPGLLGIGMITDAIWSDIDGDKDSDLLVVGEYMPIKIFINQNGSFMDQTDHYGLSKTNGWWNRIEAADLDDDGDMDFVVGNHGLNSRFKATLQRPMCMYINDFDQNGTVEQILCTFNGEKSYPLVLRHDLVKQIPTLKKKYLKYEDYKNQTITDIFTTEELLKAKKLEVFELETSVLINEGNKFILQALPIEAQFAPIFGLKIADFNTDGLLDILVGGNFYKSKPEVGRYDGSYGLMLKGLGHGKFKSLSSIESGIRMDGEVRDIVMLPTKKESLILIGRNNDSMLIYKIKSK